MTEIADLNDDQKDFLKRLVNDLQGPTTVPELLYLFEEVLGEVAPDWEVDPSSMSKEAREKVDVCMAALKYFEVQGVAEGKGD